MKENPTHPYRTAPECDHGVVFDKVHADSVDPILGRKLTSSEIRINYPRLFGLCPLGCGYNGIAYASFAHYIYGDW